MASPSILHRFGKTLVPLALGVILISFVGCGETTEDSSTSQSQPSPPSPTVPEVPTLSAACAGAVIPSIETIEAGKYVPLSRPLFMYVNKNSLKRPEVAAFMKYVLEEGQDLVSVVQYIRLDKVSLEESRTRLSEAIADVKIDGEVKGNIKIDGSSTVFPIAQAAAETFIGIHSDVEPQVGKSGTGGGFKKFVIGETDISNASRPISSSEREMCEKNKVEYLEFKVAIDGMVVVVNPENTFCDCLTVDQLKKLWEPESKVRKWNELNPDWPAEDIKLYGPDTDSGTFDYFTEVICGKSKASRADYISSTEDNVLVKGVEGDKFSLGYFGYAYYAENSKNLKIVGIHPPTSKDPAEYVPPPKTAEPEKK